MMQTTVVVMSITLTIASISSFFGMFHCIEGECSLPIKRYMFVKSYNILLGNIEGKSKNLNSDL